VEFRLQDTQGLWQLVIRSSKEDEPDATLTLASARAEGAEHRGYQRDQVHREPQNCDGGFGDG